MNDPVKIEVDRGIALHSQHKMVECITVLREVLQHDPDNVAAHLYLGHALNYRQMNFGAVREYRRVLAADPDNVDAHLGLGETYARMTETREVAALAVQELMKAIRLKPGDPEISSHLVEAEKNLRWFEREERKDKDSARQARRKYRSILRNNPDDSNAHASLGSRYMQAGNPVLAAEELAIAIRLNPEDLAARNELGRLYFNELKYELALEQFMKSHALLMSRNPLPYDGAFRNIWIWIAKTLSALGSLDEAAELLWKCLPISDIHTQPFEIYHELGVIWKKEGKWDEILAHFGKDFETYSTFTSEHYHKGVAYFHLGRLNDAITCLQDAMDCGDQFGDAQAWLDRARAELTSDSR